MDVIGLRQGMTVGEAGASYGYFTFKMSRRVGPTGVVYANDIDAGALRTIEQRSASLKVGNIKTVLGEVADPRFPRSDLDLIVVFDCLFEFSGQASWMQNARKYLKPGGRLVIVDPDRSKMASEHFLSRQQVRDFAKQAGYDVVPVDDAFLKTHMIVVLQPASVGRGHVPSIRRRTPSPGCRANRGEIGFTARVRRAASRPSNTVELLQAAHGRRR